jgi:hypothetical protein
MCDLCFPDYSEIGEIAPGYVLIVKDDEYSVLGGEGHKGHQLYTFPTKPAASPPDSLPAGQWDEALAKVEETLCLPVQLGYEFVEACLEHGGFGKENKNFPDWLLNKCGELVEIFEGVRPNPVQEPPPEHEGGYWNYRVMIRNNIMPEELAQRMDVCPASKQYGIHEVHYTDSKPDGWSKAQVCADSVPSLRWNVEKMLEAFDKPVLEDNSPK